MTLLELLFATLILLVILLGIVPLFLRAIYNNTYGGEATRLTSLAREALEKDRARSVNSAAHLAELEQERQDPDDPGEVIPGDQLVEFVTRGPLLFDSGPRSGGIDAYLGDEAWREEGVDPVDGVALLNRRDRFTSYSFADVFQGTISTAGDGTATTLGHPQKFDAPLTLDQVQAVGGSEMEEANVAIELQRGAASVGALQKVRIGSIRTM